VLQELATTPLMLSILILVYQGSSLKEIKGDVSPEVRKSQIFALYTQRMLRRRSAISRYPPQQTIYWLAYLARQMKQQGQTVFYIERMQPTWLTKKWQRRLYYGLMTGPICGLLVGLETLGTSLPSPLIALTIALITGLLFGWLSEPGREKQSTKMITRIWRQRLATSLEKGGKIGIFAGIVIGISTILYHYLHDFAYWSTISRIAAALTGGLLNGMYMSMSIGLVIRVERRIEPQEALSWSWAAIQRDIVRWLLAGTILIVGLFLALPLIWSHDKGLVDCLSYG